MTTMMLMTSFFKAMLVGLAVAVPVGPAGLLCLERATTRGWRMGLSSVVGMNIADVFSAFLVLLGVGFVSDIVNEHASTIKILVGSIFILIGLYMLWNRSRVEKAPEGKDLAYGGVSTFFLSISPSTLFLMILLFSAFELSDISRPVVLLGVGTGSVMWGMCVLFAGKKLRSILGTKLVYFKTILASLFLILGSYAAIVAFV